MRYWIPKDPQRTFPHRGELKGMGCRFSAEQMQWYAESAEVYEKAMTLLAA